MGHHATIANALARREYGDADAKLPRRATKQEKTLFEQISPELACLPPVLHQPDPEPEPVDKVLELELLLPDEPAPVTTNFEQFQSDRYTSLLQEYEWTYHNVLNPNPGEPPTPGCLGLLAYAKQYPQVFYAQYAKLKSHSLDRELEEADLYRHAQHACDEIDEMIDTLRKKVTA